MNRPLLYSTLLFLFSTSLYSAAEQPPECDLPLGFNPYTCLEQAEAALQPLFSRFTPSPDATTFPAEDEVRMTREDRALIEMHLQNSFEKLIPVMIFVIWQEGSDSKAYFLNQSPSTLAPELREQTEAMLTHFYSLSTPEERNAFIESIRPLVLENPLLHYFVTLWDTAHVVNTIFRKEAYYRQLTYADAVSNQSPSYPAEAKKPENCSPYTQVANSERPIGATVLTRFYKDKNYEQDDTYYETIRYLQSFVQCSLKEKLRALGWYLTGPDCWVGNLGLCGNREGYISFAQADPTPAMFSAVAVPTFAPDYITSGSESLIRENIIPLTRIRLEKKLQEGHTIEEYFCNDDIFFEATSITSQLLFLKEAYAKANRFFTPHTYKAIIDHQNPDEIMQCFASYYGASFPSSNHTQIKYTMSGQYIIGTFIRFMKEILFLYKNIQTQEDVITSFIL